MFRTDASELTHVVVDKGAEDYSVYVVTEVWDNEGTIECGVSYVNMGDMGEHMKMYDEMQIDIVMNC